MHKKCIVIDLDETLVHSSFKVRIIIIIIPDCAVLLIQTVVVICLCWVENERESLLF